MTSIDMVSKFALAVTKVKLKISLYGLFPPQVKRHMTPKVTTSLILGYSLLLVIGTILYSVADWVIYYLLRDPCLFYYEYYFGEKLRFMNPTSMKLMSIARRIANNIILVLTTVPNVIVLVMLVVGTILFAVILKRCGNLRKSLVAKKEKIDSANFTTLTPCIFALCVKHIFAFGPRTFENILWHFIIFDQSIYFNYCIHVSNILRAINQSTNIFVYLFIDVKFRIEFRNIFMFKGCTKLTTGHKIKINR